MNRHRLTAIYFILFIIVALVALDVARAGAQGNSQLTAKNSVIEKITGRSPAFVEPIALLHTSNPGAISSLEVGTVLRSRDAAYCDLVLLSPEIPVIHSPIRLFAYCLQLAPNERSFPTADANYDLTTERVAPELLAVLERIAQAGGESDYAAQLAVWQAHWGLSLPELQAQLGAQDLQDYAPTVAVYLHPPAATLPPDLPLTTANIPAANAASGGSSNTVVISTNLLRSSPNRGWTDAARWLPLVVVGVLAGGWLALEQRRARQDSAPPIYTEPAPPLYPATQHATREQSTLINLTSRSSLSLLPPTALSPSANLANVEQKTSVTEQVSTSKSQNLLVMGDLSPQERAARPGTLTKETRAANQSSHPAPLPRERALIDGRYQLETWVGTWDDSEVYRVRDATAGLSLGDRSNGSKPAPTYLMKTTGAAARAAHREVEISNVLSHPRLLRAHRTGNDAGWGAYLLLDDVEVQSLAAHLRQRGRLELDEALAIVVQVGQALAYLHHTGLIHCAVSPENILLTASGEVYLTNLSHATPNGGIPQFPLYEESQPPRVGVYEYAAPEMSHSIPVSPTVDVYALGAVLFTLLTGERVKYISAPGHTLMDFVDNVGLIAVVMKCLHEQPRRRYQSVTAVLQRLAIFQHKGATRGHGSTRRERERHEKQPALVRAVSLST